MKQSKILERDIRSLVEDFPFKENLDGKSVMVTGCTGLIGSLIIRTLLAIKKNYGIDIKVIGLARNEAKVKELFGLEPVEWWYDINLEEGKIPEVGYVDYIIHCASPTSSSFFINKPVETYLSLIEGTRGLLEYARKEKIKSMVYLSSVEYYGIFREEKKIKEDDLGFIEPYDVRSSYSLGKRVCESLCYAYNKEYGVPVKVARLTQVFGAGIAESDNRVFAQFSRSALEGSDIELHTEGKSAKPYCYSTDAVNAIFHILLKGKNGEGYNIANQETYINIRELAEFIQKNFNPEKDVVVKLDPNRGYAPDTLLNLDTEKLMGLGWQPKYGLKEMFGNLIEYLKEQQAGE